MAKKAKKARKGKKPNYKQGWATRRRNAARAVQAKAANDGYVDAKPPAQQAPGEARWRALTDAQKEARGWAARDVATHVRNLVDQAKADGERSLLDPQAHGQPGRGEIVGGVFSQQADRIANLARKKGGTDAIQNELAALAASSKYEGSVETDKNATKRLIETQQILADRVVCGFIAEVDHAINFHRGLPPGMTWLLNSFTVVKIVDALNKAGYSATGRSDKAVGS